ncbi:MAG: hypothetical protein ACI4WR_01795 [Bulleidia sp.]
MQKKNPRSQLGRMKRRYFAAVLLVYLGLFAIGYLVIDIVFMILEVSPYAYLAAVIVLLLADEKLTSHIINQDMKERWFREDFLVPDHGGEDMEPRKPGTLREEPETRMLREMEKKNGIEDTALMPAVHEPEKSASKEEKKRQKPKKRKKTPEKKPAAQKPAGVQKSIDLSHVTLITPEEFAAEEEAKQKAAEQKALAERLAVLKAENEALEKEEMVPSEKQIEKRRRHRYNTGSKERNK